MVTIPRDVLTFLDPKSKGFPSCLSLPISRRPKYTKKKSHSRIHRFSEEKKNSERKAKNKKSASVKINLYFPTPTFCP
jgi:hypothetical protein